MEKEVCVPFPVHWNGMVGAFAEKTADPFRIPWLIKIWQNGRGDPPGPV
jgi:hypothetical protein